MPELEPVLAVAKLVDELRKAGAPPSDQDLSRLAAQVAKVFNAREGEVAILRLSADSKALDFVFPLRLAALGSIPVTASQSLAARNVRDKRGEIVNNFQSYRHQTVFESVKLSDEEKVAPIQKILSSPMVAEGKLAGVIQISRKGQPGEPVGPDFTPADLAQLGTVGTILGKFFSELPPRSAKPAGGKR